MPIKDKTGQTFGHWTVLGFHSREQNKTMWLCRCKCGVTRAVNGRTLSDGKSASCGCVRSYNGKPRKLTCIRCRITKQFPIDFQPRYGRYAGRYFKSCKACWSISHKSSRDRKSEWYASESRKRSQNRQKRMKVYNSRMAVQYLLNHACVDCGESDWMKLQFDHVRGVKKFGISKGMSSYKWETIEAEIAKCDVRCANCHQKKSIIERGAMQHIVINNGEIMWQ